MTKHNYDHNDIMLLDLDEKLKKLPLVHLKDIARRHNELLHINLTQNKPQIIKSIITHYTNYWNDADASQAYRMKMKPHLENIYTKEELLTNTYKADKKKPSKASIARKAAAAAAAAKPVRNIQQPLPPIIKRKPGRPKKTEAQRDKIKIDKMNENTEMLNYIHKSRPDITRKKIIEEL